MYISHNALTLDKTAEAIIMELGIKWHTSLQYPDFQHANVLEPEKLQESVERLKVTKQKLLDFGATKFDPPLHVDNSINWLNDCIKNNEHGEKSQRFAEFNRTIDELLPKGYLFEFLSGHGGDFFITLASKCSYKFVGAWESTNEAYERLQEFAETGKMPGNNIGKKLIDGTWADYKASIQADMDRLQSDKPLISFCTHYGQNTVDILPP